MSETKRIDQLPEAVQKLMREIADELFADPVADLNNIAAYMNGVPVYHATNGRDIVWADGRRASFFPDKAQSK